MRIQKMVVAVVLTVAASVDMGCLGGGTGMGGGSYPPDGGVYGDPGYSDGGFGGGGYGGGYDPSAMTSEGNLSPLAPVTSQTSPTSKPTATATKPADKPAEGASAFSFWNPMTWFSGAKGTTPAATATAAKPTETAAATTADKPATESAGYSWWNPMRYLGGKAAATTAEKPATETAAPQELELNPPATDQRPTVPVKKTIYEVPAQEEARPDLTA